MSQHHTFFGKLFGWIGDLFHNADKTLLQITIDVTNALKTALNSGVIDLVTGLIPGTVDDKIVMTLRNYLPVVLADEMLLQSVGSISTEPEAEDLAKKLVDSFGGLSDQKKEKLYTSVSAQIYIFLQQHLHDEKVTFGEAASLVESMYQSWLKSKEDSDN